MIVHSVYKKWEKEKFYYLDLDTGEPISVDFQLKIEDLYRERPSEFEKIIDEYITGCSLAENDILYVRFPYGKSYISSYRVIRDKTGNKTNVEVLEKILLFSDKNGVVWDFQLVMMVIISPMVCLMVGVIILKKEKKSH